MFVIFSKIILVSLLFLIEICISNVHQKYLPIQTDANVVVVWDFLNICIFRRLSLFIYLPMKSFSFFKFTDKLIDRHQLGSISTSTTGSIPIISQLCNTLTYWPRSDVTGKYPFLFSISGSTQLASGWCVL